MSQAGRPQVGYYSDYAIKSVDKQFKGLEQKLNSLLFSVLPSVNDVSIKAMKDVTVTFSSQRCNIPGGAHHESPIVKAWPVNLLLIEAAANIEQAVQILDRVANLAAKGFPFEETQAMVKKVEVESLVPSPVTPVTPDTSNSPDKADSSYHSMSDESSPKKVEKPVPQPQPQLQHQTTLKFPPETYVLKKIPKTVLPSPSLTSNETLVSSDSVDIYVRLKVVKRCVDDWHDLYMNQLQAKVPLGTEIQMSCSWFLSASHFYVHYDYDRLTELNDLIQVKCREYLRSLPSYAKDKVKLKKEEIGFGTICAALYSGDYRFYRARIMEVKQDIVEVEFFDFGNVEPVWKKDLLPLDEDLILGFPIQTVKCRLPEFHDKGEDHSRRLSNAIFGIMTSSSASMYGTFDVDTLESEKEEEHPFFTPKHYVVRVSIGPDRRDVITMAKFKYFN